jgi:OOP family OmpA-OmpF porin
MKKIIAITLLFSAAAMPAMAQSDRFWYGALDIGRLNMQNTLYANPGSMTVSAGYRMSRNLALEGGVTLIGDSTLVYGSGTTTASQGDARFLAVGILPLAQNVELFGKAGLGFHTAKITGTGSYSGTYSKETTTNLVVGFGAQFNFNSSFGLRLQYEALGKSKASPGDPGADISRLSLGGVLNF